MKLTVLPLTPDRWPDLEAILTPEAARLLGAAGASLLPKRNPDSPAWHHPFQIQSRRPQGTRQSRPSPRPCRLSRRDPGRLDFGRASRRIPQIAAIASDEARGQRPRHLVRYLLRRPARVSRPGRCPCSAQRRHRLCPTARCETHRGLPRRQVGSISRRRHVVRTQVHVRPRGFQGGGAAETNAPRRSAQTATEGRFSCLRSK